MEKKSLATLREYSAERFARHVLFQRGESIAFVLNFAPGQALPEHRHADAVVYVLVLEGSGTVTVDGVKTTAAPGDAFCIEGEELFSFQNTGSEPCRLYVVLSKTPGGK